jgi:hypothetical protein
MADVTRVLLGGPHVAFSLHLQLPQLNSMHIHVASSAASAEVSSTAVLHMLRFTLQLIVYLGSEQTCKLDISCVSVKLATPISTTFRPARSLLTARCCEHQARLTSPPLSQAHLRIAAHEL